MLLEESGGDGSNPERRRILKQLYDAGGGRMAEAVVERLPEHLKEKARTCLESIRGPEDIHVRNQP